MRVVIADDHWAVREGLRLALAGIADVEVVGDASSGVALIDLVAEVQPDVVLLDISMPGMSGLDALAILRDRHPALPVVMLSMHDRPVFVRRAMEIGAAGYVLKSAGSDEVVRALQVAVSGGVHLQGEIAGPALGTLRPNGGNGHLSPRECEVLARIADGMGNKQIARTLSLSEATVKSYLRTAFERLGANSRAEAVATAMRLGLIT